MSAAVGGSLWGGLEPSCAVSLPILPLTNSPPRPTSADGCLRLLSDLSKVSGAAQSSVLPLQVEEPGPRMSLIYRVTSSI